MWQLASLANFVTTLQMLKYLEEQDSLDNIEGPPDLSEGSKIIHNLMASINKVPQPILHCSKQSSVEQRDEL